MNNYLEEGAVAIGGSEEEKGFNYNDENNVNNGVQRMG
jgi:hypothetical protein